MISMVICLWNYACSDLFFFCWTELFFNIFRVEINKAFLNFNRNASLEIIQKRLILSFSNFINITFLLKLIKRDKSKELATTINYPLTIPSDIANAPADRLNGTLSDITNFFWCSVMMDPRSTKCQKNTRSQRNVTENKTEPKSE